MLLAQQTMLLANSSKLFYKLIINHSTKRYIPCIRVAPFVFGYCKIINIVI